MERAEDSSFTSKGAEFGFEDGTIEIVFQTAEGRILTVREYPTRTAFDRATANATYRGENESVLELPDLETFEDG